MRIGRCAITAAVAVLWAVGSAAFAQPVSSVITYQGQLKSGSAPANGDFAMIFRLYDAESGGSQVGPTLTFDGLGGNPPEVVVAEGLFTVGLDFEAASYNGEERWLEITVDGTPLTPRQRLAAAPYARYAARAGAPWIPDSFGSVSLEDPSGRVGIGTANPSAKLHVQNGEMLFGNSTDNKQWILGYLDSQDVFYVEENSVGRHLTIANGGNVGIGTTPPQAKLQIDDGALRLRNNADNKNWEFAYDATDNYFYLDEFGAARRFVIKNGGNVGIGTTNPNRHLVVKSPTALNESTWIQIDSGSVSSQYSGLELMDRGAAKWEVGKTPSNEFYVEEPGIARRLTIQPGSGNFLLSNDASISGVDQIVGFNDLRLSGDAVGGPDLQIRPNGNVGIGTSTPGNKLTVAGIIETTTGGVRFPDGSVQTTAFGGGGGGGGDFWTNNGDDIRNINPGNVGIGVVDPGSKLDVAGGIRTAGGAPTGDPGSVNVGYAFENSTNSGMFAPSEGQVSLFLHGVRGLMMTPTGFDPAPAVHLGIDLISDALIQTGRLNVRGLFDEFSGTAISATGGDGWPAIRVESGGDDAVGVFVQGSLGENSIGVHATGDVGISGDGETYGVYGFGPTGVSGVGSEVGVEGSTLGAAGVGVRGTSQAVAVHGDGGIGVRATGRLYGLQAELPADPEIAVGHAIIAIVEDQVNDFAGTFHGKVHVNGMLTKAGGTFRIDHPLDPENKTLSHSFVESPEMMNIYNGNIVTDAQGMAWVQLPDYFEALNREFRYQLTVVDATDFAQARVVQKIKNNVFGIATDRPGVEVSWQVTGVRKDPWAEQNRVQVEEIKLESQRGLYLNAEAYGQPREKGIFYNAASGGSQQPQPAAAAPAMHTASGGSK